LITGDEEDISVNGTVKLLQWVAARGEKFDHCVLGEPSNVEVLGDCIKVGRRGSQSGTLYVDGVQGHVAYPHRAANPVPDISRLIVALSEEPLDHGSAQFQARTSNYFRRCRHTASNVIPAQARAKFNIRFNDHHTQETLGSLIELRMIKAAGNRIARGCLGLPTRCHRDKARHEARRRGPRRWKRSGRGRDLSIAGDRERVNRGYCRTFEFGSSQTIRARIRLPAAFIMRSSIRIRNVSCV